MNTNCLEGMKCPKCGHDSKLLVRASSWVALTDDGTDPFDDALDMVAPTEWDNDSEMECPECNFSGCVEDFQSPHGGLKEYQLRITADLLIDVHAHSANEALKTLKPGMRLLDEPLPAPGPLQRVQLMSVVRPPCSGDIIEVFDLAEREFE